MPTNDEIVSQSIPVKVTFVDVPEVTCVKLGPVVEIRRGNDKYGDFCHTNCDFSSRYICPHTTGPTSDRFTPCDRKDTCPRRAPEGFEWRLALVAKDDGDGF